MTNKHIWGEMKLKNTMRCHLTLFRLAAITLKNKTTTENNKCWWGWKEIRNLIYHRWGCKSAATVGDGMAGPQKSEYRLINGPAIPLLDINPLSVFIPIPKKFSSVSSVAQSCLTLCNPMDRSMPNHPVHHQLPEFTQTHVHWVGDAIQPSHPL